MKPNVKEKWVAALRSGEYRKGFDYLKTGAQRESFCYLGVLTDIYIKEHGLEWESGEDRIFKFGGTSMCLAPEVMEWSGLDDAEECLLYRGGKWGIVDISDDRDYSLPFEEFADLVEDQL